MVWSITGNGGSVSSHLKGQTEASQCINQCRARCESLRAAAQFPWQHLPWYAATQDEQNSSETSTVLQPSSHADSKA